MEVIGASFTLISSIKEMIEVHTENCKDAEKMILTMEVLARLYAPIKGLSYTFMTYILIYLTHL